LGKSYGIKPSTIGNTLGDGNTLGTRGEKIPLPCPLKKGKNWMVRWCMLSLPIGCMKFSFQTIGHHFWPRLMAGAEFWGLT